MYYDSEINHSRLYPNLDRLVERGFFLEKGELDRRTNYYVTTDEGDQKIRDRREWEAQYAETTAAIA